MLLAACCSHSPAAHAQLHEEGISSMTRPSAVLKSPRSVHSYSTASAIPRAGTDDNGRARRCRIPQSKRPKHGSRAREQKQERQDPAGILNPNPACGPETPTPSTSPARPPTKTPNPQPAAALKPPPSPVQPRHAEVTVTVTVRGGNTAQRKSKGNWQRQSYG